MTHWIGPLAFLFIAALLSPFASGEEMTLDYLYRYDCQPSQPDHLVDVIEVGNNRAVVASNKGVALVDLAALTLGGTSNYIHRLAGPNARNVYLKGSRYLYVNLFRGELGGAPGFSVVKINPGGLQWITTIDEGEEVHYEKMCVRHDYLYVAAHSDGLRIFDISDPENPVLAGSITKGFVDAWAIHVLGQTAFVADGAGGLKVVDVSDKTAPYIMDGEDLDSAAGTAEDVTVKDGDVYVAAGGAGVAVYPQAARAFRPKHDLQTWGQQFQGRQALRNRILFDTGGCAKDLCWVGDDLAVATIGGFVVLGTENPRDLRIIAKETAHRRTLNARLRLCMAVGAAPGNRIMAANWNYMDVYELKPAQGSSQPDINSSVQRIRFEPAGGSATVTVSNNGAAALDVTSVASTISAFSTTYPGGILLPGEDVSFEIDYDGDMNGTGVVALYSNDPDENPLPIQVFGHTDHLDPGEPAVDFTMPILKKDPPTGEFVEELFTLSDHLGKIVWLQVYGSW